jgi:hypothetical protein
MRKILADENIHKVNAVVCSNTYFRGVCNWLIIESRRNTPHDVCNHLGLFYHWLLRLEDELILSAIHVIDLDKSILLAAYQAVGDPFCLMMDERKHMNYRLSRFMVR